MPSYIELISELSDLTKQAEQVGAPLGRDAIGEALTALKDLARLEERIRKTMSGLDALDSQHSESLLKLLRESATSHPQLAAFFAENPNPIVSGLSFSAGANTEDLMRDDEQRGLLQDLRIDTHAWYHRAHRLIKVVRMVPILRKFECNQVSIVRNHLLEHPEGDHSGVTHASHGYDKQNGPVVKALRVGNQAGRHIDEGLYVASESLRKTLGSVIAQAAFSLSAANKG